MKFINKNSGITLIALVVTIIVMLLLAAVVVNMSINGRLFFYAGKANKDTEKSKEKEYIALAYSETKMKTNLEDNENFASDFQNAIIKTSNGRDVSVSDDEFGFLVEFRDVNRMYSVTEDGSVDSIEPVSDETPGELAGSGTEDDPYKVQSIEDLVVLSIMVNGGDSGLGIEENDFDGEYVSLEQSLNFKSRLSYCNPTTTQYDTYLGGNGGETLINELSRGNGFKSIGINIDLETGTSFKGIFLGNSNELRNIYLTDKYNTLEGEYDSIKNYSFFSLFGHTAGARIDGLNVYGIGETDYVIGAIVGDAKNSTITNCTSGVKYIRNGYICGGVIGYTSECTVSNCNYTGTIDLTGSVGKYTGGVVGYVDNSTLTNCINSGTIKTNSTDRNNYIGGVVGYINGGTLTECICRANVNLHNVLRMGGLIGTMKSSGAVTLTRCSNESTINVTNDPASDANTAYAVGGLLSGANKTTNLTSCYNKGNINTTNIIYVAGIAAFANGDTFTDSKFLDVHNEGAITAQGTTIYAAGIIGQKGSTLLECCSNTGAIYAKNSWNYVIRAAGIVAFVNTKGWVCNCYNSAPITGATTYNLEIGGITGYSINGFTGYCYNTGNISGVGRNCTRIGGISGNERAGQIFGCYNKGEIHVTDDYTSNELVIGGIAGMFYYAFNSTNAYNFGDIVDPPTIASVGGTYGWRYVNGSGDGTDFVDFYYETHTWPGTSYDAPIATPVTSIDKEQMIEDIETARESLGRLGFTDEVPDFSTWVIDENVNDGYPIFSWQQ